MANKKEKNPVGRPSKITAEVLGKLEQAFSIGASDAEACRHAGINPDTLYEYQKKNPKYTEKKEALKKTPVLKAKHTVFKNLDDPKVAMWYLEKRDKDFSSKIEQKITNTTPQIVVASQSDADVLQRIADVNINKDVS